MIIRVSILFKWNIKIINIIIDKISVVSEEMSLIINSLIDDKSFILVITNPIGVCSVSISVAVAAIPLLYAKNISGYATESAQEYVAESFLSYFLGENKADPKLIEIFKRVQKWMMKSWL